MLEGINVVKVKRINTRITGTILSTKLTRRLGLYSVGRRGMIDRYRSLDSALNFCPRGYIVNGCNARCRRLTSYSIMVGTTNSIGADTGSHSNRLFIAASVTHA